MKNTKYKRIASVAIAIVTLAWAVGGVFPQANAQSTADLQAQINALLAQIQALQAQLGQTGGGTASYNFTRNLTVGSTGADVFALQQFLNTHGSILASSGPGSPGNETQYFGPLTRAALAAYQLAHGINPPAGYFGPITRAYIATQTTGTGGGTGTGTGTGTPPPSTSPMSVILAPDNPPSANVQRGSANNTILKLVFTGGPTAVNITGLTLNSYGTTEATGSNDIPAMKLWDENGIQIGNNRTPAGNQVNFVIVPALTIPANGTRTITVTADIGVNATVVAQARYGLASTSSIIGGSTFSGAFPIIGNSFTIVPAGQLGSLTVSKFSTVPKSSVKTGDTQVVLSQFNISAGSNEDVAVNQITLTNTGTISSSDVSNFYLRQVGSTVNLAGPAVMVNNKITFNLSSPISLTKGASTNLQLVGDITGDQNSNGRTAIIGIAAGGVVARGATSGVNITSSGSFTGDSVVLGLGTLVVSMSASHPQGINSFLISTTNSKTIAAFDVRTNGESVILNNVYLTFTANPVIDGTHYLSNVGLYNGDSLISDLHTVNQDGVPVSFSLNYTVPANTTATFSVKGVTNTLGVAVGGSTSLTTTWSTAAVGYGLSSGSTINSNANVGTTPVTIYPSGKVTPSSDSIITPYSQGILAPVNNVTLGALKIYAQRENMKLTNLVVTIDGTAGSLPDGSVSSLTLYSSDGTTALSNPVSTVNTGVGSNMETATFSSSDFLSDIVFSANANTTILVRGNVSSAANGANGVVLKIADAANNLTLVGIDSGTTYDWHSDPLHAPIAMSFTSPYNGGTYSFNSKLIEVVKDSASPSGSVSRGTLQPYAIWDVNNVSSDLSNAVLTSLTLTSKTGLPSGLIAGDNILFQLYDGNGNVVCQNGVGGCTVTLNPTAGTVTFANAGMMTIPIGTPKQLVLKITTTDTAKWPSNTQMQWSIENASDVTITGGAIGFGGTTYSIPARTNIITLP